MPITSSKHILYFKCDIYTYNKHEHVEIRDETNTNQSFDDDAPSFTAYLRLDSDRLELPVADLGFSAQMSLKYINIMIYICKNQEYTHIIASIIKRYLLFSHRLNMIFHQFVFSPTNTVQYYRLAFWISILRGQIRYPAPFIIVLPVHTDINTT